MLLLLFVAGQLADDLHARVEAAHHHPHLVAGINWSNLHEKVLISIYFLTSIYRKL
jgi:hypothetical protein